MAMCSGSLGLQDAASTSALFCLFFTICRHFRDRRAQQRRFRLLQYVLQLQTPGYSISTKPSISPSHGVERKSEKVYFVRGKQRVKGRGEKEKKDDVKSHQCEGSLPSPLSGLPFPFTLCFLATLPRVKQFCCCLVDYKSRPALPCKASQDKTDVLSRQGHFVARVESNRVSAKIFLNVTSRFAIGTGRTSWPNRK